jgi:uncharacterized protein YbjQ (UPF0145 family)
MKAIRQIGSIFFVLGLFVVVFIGVPWHVVTSEDPVIPLWLQAAIFSLLGGIFIVLATLAIENMAKPKLTDIFTEQLDESIPLQNSASVPGRDIKENLGLVQGQTVFAIWIGQDLSAIVRLILGGELTEYTGMMAMARQAATNRMIAQAKEKGADAVINVRYMTTSVIGSAAELLVYGTAVKFS